MPSVIIIGGGISGLSAAYFLEQRARESELDLRITLLEKSGKLGGVIQSEHVQLANTGQRFLCEAGPDSLLTTKPAAIELCRKLGLGEQLIPSNDALRKTYVLHHGALRSLPDGLMFVVPTKIRPMLSSGLLSIPGRLRLLLSPVLSPGPLPDDQDTTVDEYITRRFGHEVSDRLAEPLLNAVYGADVRSMSARAVFPQLLALEKQHGSLWRAFAKQMVRGRESRHASGSRGEAGQGAAKAPPTIFVTLRDGMAGLPEAVRGALKATEIVQQEEASLITRAAEGYQVASSTSERRCDAILLATPAPVAAQLLEHVDPEVSGELRKIVYRSVAIAAMGYRSTPPAARAQDWGKRGFGFVVPCGEGCETIACTWVHNKFSHRVPPDAALLRSFFGGSRNEGIDQVPDAAVFSTARKENLEIMGLQQAPDFNRIYRWARCMPQYSVGHIDLLARIELRLAGLPGIQLAGNAYRGVGIPDCIQSASKAAEAICDLLARH